MAKPVKKVTRGISKGLARFDQSVGLQGQIGVFKRGFKDILGVPEYEQAKPVTRPKATKQARPLAAAQKEGDNQEKGSRELYRRRRARGMATAPKGLMGRNVNRKTLLGE